MAGDWIKIRTDLTDDPNVFLLSEILSIECPTVVGLLVTFWGWMDRHTPDGTGVKLTKGVIDRRVGHDGFAEALIQIGWLTGENMDFTLPKFERHNGASAKARALEAEAKQIRRKEKASEKSVGQSSDKKESKSPTREEKRREENNNPPVSPQGGAKRKRKLPDDFSLTDHRRSVAVAYWLERDRPDLIPEDEFEKFLANHRSKGSTMADWDAAWKTWYCNAVKFNQPPRGLGNGHTPTAKELERQRLRDATSGASRNDW